MASSAALLPSAAGAAALLSLLMLLLSPGADARPGLHFHPCKTLFISYTFSSSSQISSSDSTKPYASFTVYRIIRPLRPFHHSISSFPHPIQIDHPSLPSEPNPTFGISSFHDRAKDILFVVIGLLFGVVCGALTAATIYLAWSLLANRYDACGSYGDDFEEDDESPKKLGYVMMAEPAPAKEGYEGN